MFISPTEVDDDLDAGAHGEVHDLVDLDDDLIELEPNQQNTLNRHRAAVNRYRPLPGHQDHGPHEGDEGENRHRAPNHH